MSVASPVPITTAVMWLLAEDIIHLLPRSRTSNGPDNPDPTAAKKPNTKLRDAILSQISNPNEFFQNSISMLRSLRAAGAVQDEVKLCIGFYETEASDKGHEYSVFATTAVAGSAPDFPSRPNPIQLADGSALRYKHKPVCAIATTDDLDKSINLAAEKLPPTTEKGKVEKVKALFRG